MDFGLDTNWTSDSDEERRETRGEEEREEKRGEVSGVGVLCRIKYSNIIGYYLEQSEIQKSFQKSLLALYSCCAKSLQFTFITNRYSLHSSLESVLESPLSSQLLRCYYKAATPLLRQYSTVVRSQNRM